LKEKKKKHNKYENQAKPSKEIDFHKMGILSEDDITRICNLFLEECISENIKKALIITGKGLHSKNGISKIKPIVQSVLRRKKEIKTFSDSRIDRGYSGAIELSFY